MKRTHLLIPMQTSVVLMILLSSLVVGCKDQAPVSKTKVDYPYPQTTVNDYWFPKLENIDSIEYMKQGSESWHPVPKELWQEIADCFEGNQAWLPKPVDPEDGFLMWHPPPYSYHFQLKCSNGDSTLFSLYGGESLFDVNSSDELLLFKEPKGKRLHEILEGLENPATN